MEEENQQSFGEENQAPNEGAQPEAASESDRPAEPRPLGPDLEAEQSTSMGPIIGLILIVILIIAGGLYFWLQQQETDLEGIETPPEEEPEEEPVTEDPETDEVVEDLRDVSDSDELEAIERDLEETDLDSLDLTDEELDEMLEVDVNEL